VTDHRCGQHPPPARQHRSVPTHRPHHRRVRQRPRRCRRTTRPCRDQGPARGSV